MKKLTRILSLALVLVLCLSVLPVGAAAASSGWQKGSDGSWYYYKNGSPVTGWQKISGTWYYFVPNWGGVMCIGWMNTDPRYFTDESVDVDQFDGDWYYFKSSGAMATGWQKIGGDYFYFTSSGAAKMDGWQWDGSNWYYFQNGGYYYGGFVPIDGKYYYFKDSGALFTGWKQLDGVWWYFTSNGAVEEGWKKISGKWYYFIDYEMVADYWVDDANGDWYRLGSDGAMVTSKWVKDTYYDDDELQTDWYYQLSSGKSAMGWLKLGGVWYYFDPDEYGMMVTGGPLWIDGNYYFFKDSGALYTGWKRDPNSLANNWWYFTSSGAVKDGWKQISGKWYQFQDYICLNP